MKKETPFKVYGIFGHPLGHTLSPGMQEAAFEKSGLRAFYLVFDLEPRDFKKTAGNLRRCVLDGFNLTVPYKETVLRYLDLLTPEARAVGAVNTVFKKNRKWCGTNTDVYGFLTALAEEGGFHPRNKRALVIGSGGAARAAVYGLLKSGARAVWVLNRNTARAEKLVKDFKKNLPQANLHPASLQTPALASLMEEADLIVNATSAGLKPGETALPPGVIPEAGRKKLFYDLIYNRETEFLAAARKKGHQTLGGLGMLLFQGAKAFEHWTGKKAPVDVMRKALLEAFHGKKAA